MSELPPFYTFREACEFLEDGAAVYRYGSEYPIFHKWDFMVRRIFWGGSTGACFDMTRGAEFTPEEQASTNWVLIPKEAWAKRYKPAAVA